MTYCQFVQMVEKKVKEELKERVCVSIYTARKYNGTVRKGILFSEQGSNVSPTIYLEEYYRQFQLGETIDLITKEILILYGKIRFREPWKEGIIRNYSEVRDRIIYRLINKEENELMLQDMPYVPYLDLAIVFYVLVEASDYGTATMPVKLEHLGLWNVKKEQVYEQACKNTCHLFPSEFRAMSSVIAELTNMEDTGGEDALYVLSNHLRSFGAAAVLYPGCLCEIGEYLGEDYYVLPSSVHEMIIIRESAAPGRRALSAMVTDINATQVEKEEVLSNQAYYFDRMKGSLSL